MPSFYQIEYLIIFYTWNHLTVCKQISYGLFENDVAYKLFIYESNIWYVYKKDLALNTLEGLICCKIQASNQQANCFYGFLWSEQLEIIG